MKYKTTDSKERIYRAAVNSWGEYSQLGMAQEECGELTAVINQYIRGRKSKRDVAEEIADVEIMLAQLRIIIGSEYVEEYKNRKIERLVRNLNGGNG